MIHHVALEVRRADAGADERFWALLGFVRVQPPASVADRAMWLERGPTQIHLMYAGEPDVPGDGHVAVVAEAYGRTLEALRAAGHEPEPRRAHWGAARCFVRSPSGHRVEVMASPPGAGA